MGILRCLALLANVALAGPYAGSAISTTTQTQTNWLSGTYEFATQAPASPSVMPSTFTIMVSGPTGNVIASSITLTGTGAFTIVSSSGIHITGGGVTWADGSVSTTAFSSSQTNVVSSSLTITTQQFISTAPLTLNSSSVTLQGNQFNNANELIQLNSSGGATVPGHFDANSLSSDGNFQTDSGDVSTNGTGGLSIIGGASFLSVQTVAAMGQSVVFGTSTVEGNAFSVGGSSFQVQGGSATLAYSLTAKQVVAIAVSTYSIISSSGIQILFGGITWPNGTVSTSAFTGGSSVSQSSLTINNQQFTSTAPLTLNSSSVTLQGNVFNGNTELVQTNSSGFFPGLNGSLIQNISQSNVSGLSQVLASVAAATTTLSVSTVSLQNQVNAISVATAAIPVPFYVSGTTIRQSTAAYNVIISSSLTVLSSSTFDSGAIYTDGHGTINLDGTNTIQGGPNGDVNIAAGNFLNGSQLQGNSLNISAGQGSPSLGGSINFLVANSGSFGFTGGPVGIIGNLSDSGSFSSDGNAITTNGSGDMTINSSLSINPNGSSAPSSELSIVNSFSQTIFNVTDNGLVLTESNELDDGGGGMNVAGQITAGAFSSFDGGFTVNNVDVLSITGGTSGILNENYLLMGAFSYNGFVASGSGIIATTGPILANQGIFSGTVTVQGSALSISGGFGNGPVSILNGTITVGSSETIKGSAFSVGGSSFVVTGGSATVAYGLTVGSLNGLTLNSSSITLQGNSFNGASQLVKISTAGNLVANDGVIASTGVFSSTLTVQGNAFSVGGSSFVVQGGSATVAYGLTVAGQSLSIGTSPRGPVTISMFDAGTDVGIIKWDDRISNLGMIIDATNNGTNSLAGANEYVLLNPYDSNVGHNVGVGTTAPGYQMDINGNTRVQGQEIVTGTVTVQGNAFSVGGSSFVVAGGSATVAYGLTVSGQEIVVGTATIQGFSFSVGGSTMTVSSGKLSIGSGCTEIYYCNGGTVGGLLIRGNSSAEATACTTGTGTLVDEKLCLP